MKVNIRHIVPPTPDQIIHKVFGKTKIRDHLLEHHLENPFLVWVSNILTKLVKDKIKVTTLDVYDADVTMAKVILPVLETYVQHKQSYGFVDDCDVPANLKTGFDYDETNLKKKWDYVLEEMIFAFRAISNSRMFIHDFHEETTEWDKSYSCAVMELEKRINNGTALFGKYFSSIWS